MRSRGDGDRAAAGRGWLIGEGRGADAMIDTVPPTGHLSELACRVARRRRL